MCSTWPIDLSIETESRYPHRTISPLLSSNLPIARNRNWFQTSLCQWEEDASLVTDNTIGVPGFVWSWELGCVVRQKQSVSLHPSGLLLSSFSLAFLWKSCVYNLFKARRKTCMLLPFQLQPSSSIFQLTHTGSWQHRTNGSGKHIGEFWLLQSTCVPVDGINPGLTVWTQNKEGRRTPERKIKTMFSDFQLLWTRNKAANSKHIWWNKPTHFISQEQKEEENNQGPNK